MTNPNYSNAVRLSAAEARALGYTEGISDRRYAGPDADMPSPLSGEMAGESIPEIFGYWPDDEILDAYEEGYADGWADEDSEPESEYPFY